MKKIEQLPQEKDRKEARNALVSNWAQFDPEGARKFLESAPPEVLGEGNERYQIVSSVACSSELNMDAE